MSQAKSSGSIAWKIIVGVLVGLLLIILAAEFGARAFFSHQLRSDVREQAEADGLIMEGDPEVSFGASPVLFGLIGGNINEMDLDIPSTLEVHEDGEFRGQPATKVHVEGLDVQTEIADYLRAQSQLPDEFLTSTIQSGIREESGLGGIGELVVSEITTDPNEEVINVKFLGGAANLTLTPSVAEDGSIAIEASEAKIFGLSLPDSATEGISNSLNSGMREAVAGDMSVTDIDFYDEGLMVTVEAHNVKLSEISQNTESDEQVEAPAETSAPAAA